MIESQHLFVALSAAKFLNFGSFALNMPPATAPGLSCPNSLCDSNDVFPDYDTLCAHLANPSTRCSQWAKAFIEMMNNGPHSRDYHDRSSYDSDDDGM
jgi:hypothetical protein